MKLISKQTETTKMRKIAVNMVNSQTSQKYLNQSQTILKCAVIINNIIDCWQCTKLHK